MRGWVALASVAVVAACASACHATHEYETEVRVERSHVVYRDENGRALTADLEVAYTECPGEQLETVRGDEEFSACISKFPVGAAVKMRIVHRWAAEGHYVWEVVQVGDCRRQVDASDEASFSQIRECSEWRVNGAVVGFECRVAPRKELVRACPWFARR